MDMHLLAQPIVIECRPVSIAMARLLNCTGQYVVSASIRRTNVRLPQIQRLRCIHLRCSSPRTGLRRANAGEGTYSSARRDWDLDVFGASGYHAFWKVWDFDTLRDVVVARGYDLRPVSIYFVARDM